MLKSELQSFCRQSSAFRTGRRNERREQKKNVPYEQFLEWAVDGEYAAHTVLGRKAAEIMGGSVEVAAEPGAGQIFGKF